MKEFRMELTTSRVKLLRKLMLTLLLSCSPHQLQPLLQRCLLKSPSLYLHQALDQKLRRITRRLLQRRAVASKSPKHPALKSLLLLWRRLLAVKLPRRQLLRRKEVLQRASKTRPLKQPQLGRSWTLPVLTVGRKKSILQKQMSSWTSLRHWWKLRPGTPFSRRRNSCLLLQPELQRALIRMQAEWSSTLQQRWRQTSRAMMQSKQKTTMFWRRHKKRQLWM
mmetsp:Transcript_41460/g.97350  ORF Transcript_41460/g.97350 Transcript_41460/m.97350 type:complete len:222 (-) Transcript_41460:782-1447(-)